MANYMSSGSTRIDVRGLPNCRFVDIVGPSRHSSRRTRRSSGSAYGAPLSYVVSRQRRAPVQWPQAAGTPSAMVMSYQESFARPQRCRRQHPKAWGTSALPVQGRRIKPLSLVGHPSPECPQAGSSAMAPAGLRGWNIKDRQVATGTGTE